MFIDIYDSYRKFEALIQNDIITHKETSFCIVHFAFCILFQSP